MKKLLLILAALFAAFLPIHSVANLSAQETEELNMQDMDNGWSSTYDAATRTITFTAAWGGRGWWLGRDLSTYTKVVAEFATPAPCGGVMKVDYGDDTSAEQGYEVGATSVELVLDDAKKAMVNKIYFSASEAGQLAFKTVYLVKAGASQPGVGEVTEELNMQDMDNGWSSTYDAATRTITFEAAWGGRGWWLGRDLSAYTKVVAEFAAPAPCSGVMKVDYGDNTSAEQGYEAGATSVEILLDDAKKVMVNKIYFSASEAGQLAFKTVYLVKAGGNNDTPVEGGEQEELNMQNMDNGWSSTYDAATRTITFTAAWGGRGWWLGRDLSGYTKVVAEFAAPAPCGGVMKVDYGDNTSAEQGYEVGATGVEILLDEAKKVMVNKIYFSASEAGKLAFKTVYLVKVAGGNDDPVEEGEHEALSLSAMDYGWSSTYNSSTQTITFESAWAARGWLLNKDLSDYTKAVVEFAVATPCGGVLKAEYAEEQYNEQGFETGAQRVELVLDETHKSHVVGIFFSTPEAVDLVIKSAYLVKNNATGVENVQTIVNDDMYYNILGQKVAYPTRGNIYIHNGKKVIYQ